MSTGGFMGKEPQRRQTEAGAKGRQADGTAALGSIQRAFDHELRHD